MAPHQDRLTLDALLSDPLTQLVMRSDGITPADVAEAFAIAQTGLAGVPSPAGRTNLCTTFDRWLGRSTSCRMG
jgi:hypothetical protein